MPVRLVRIPLASSLTPQEALLALRDDARPFALVGDWAGGGALVGSEPVRRLAAGDDPLAVLDDVPAVEATADRGVGGGWVGWLGYRAAARADRAVPQPPRPVALAEASWAFYDHLLRLDAHGRWWFEALWADEDRPRLERRLELLTRRMGHAGAPRALPYAAGPFTSSPVEDGHAAAVEHATRAITAGDLYQANLTLRLEAAFAGAAIDLFATTSAELRPARGAYVGDADAQIASLSPELFLARHGREVRTAPIKGTVRRTGDPAELHALRASAKDAAEHVMIVDLMRNDLGRVARFGSVAAAPAPRAEEHPGVWHLVSDVTATLREDVSDGDLLRATFPPGSVTGAPKLKALEVIATLESTGREAYTGAIGFCSPLAGLELNVAIRTFEVARERVWLGAGGGVVADSDPQAEVAEALVKAAPLLAAAGAQLERDAAPARRRRPADAPPLVTAARPDPAHGVLETLLAVDGRPVGAEAHVERLATAVGEVFGEELDRDLAAARIRDAAAAVRTTGPQRLRAIVGPGGGFTVGAARVDPRRIFPASPVTLVPVTLPGGAGRHKWADRRLLDAETGDREILLTDLDGHALETGRGTLWIAEGDRLVTPLADGRILAGTVRALLLGDEGLDARAELIGLERLRDADAVLVTSSIRGVQAALVEGAAAAPVPGPAHAAVAARLVRAWRLAEPAPA